MVIERLFSDKTSKLLLDLGPQPIGNRFLQRASESQPMYSVKISQHEKTGLIFLETPFPVEELVPRYDWITYGEPEDHLDDLVNVLRSVAGISSNTTIGGVSFKDNSTLARMRKLGGKTWRIDPVADLGITAKGAGVESIQHALSQASANAMVGKMVGKYGRSDILIVRHILEHVYDIVEFTTALKTMIKPDGFIVFEIPDCTRALDLCDYTTIWEEHLFYFTPSTFKAVLEACGFRLAHFAVYPYPFESSLIAVAQVSADSFSDLSAHNVQEELERAAKYSAYFHVFQTKVVEFFSKCRDEHEKIALLGAGHLACTFIWLFQLQGFIDCIIDDNPHKQGLFMPGSALPILPSTALKERKISLCLLSLNPLAENKVVSNNAAFLERGGRFLSIFPGSPRSCLVSVDLK